MKSLSTCRNISAIILVIFSAFPVITFAQYTPIAINGFNHDVVAETGTSSLTTTTISVDGIPVSNKVIYTQTFRTLNSFGGGGLPDNGLITSGADNYQLASYSSNNALLIQRNQNGDIGLATPSKYKSIRVLCFSTEGASLVNAILFFADGTQTAALTNYTLGDWFNNTTNLVLSGMGRCTRATPASGADGYPTNPRMYYIDIPLSCTDMQKDLVKINFANVTTAGSNAPYPNVLIMAASGITYSQNITATVNNASCSVNGNATLAVTGSASPYNISWNTVPVQTGNTATNLAAGNYIATITDVNSCSSTYPVTVSLNNNLSVTAHADTSICYGASFFANTQGNATGYNWSPTNGVSDPSSANPVLSPTSTTTYTVTGTLGSCNLSRNFTVTVASQILLNTHADTTICLGASFNSNVNGNAAAYSWSPITGVSDPSIANPVLSPVANTTYSVTATTGNCSVTKTFSVTILPALSVFAGNDITIQEGATVQLQGTGPQGTYLWSPAAGLSATNILNPVAKPLSTATYLLTITNLQGCTGSDDIEITVVPNCIKPMNAITPNGDGINDRWLVVNANCLGSASVHVYNRYGSPVYENKDYKNDWEGTYKGKPVPDGTYYFVIEYPVANGGTGILKGDLTIIR